MIGFRFVQAPITVATIEAACALVRNSTHQWAALVDTAFDYPARAFYQGILHRNCYAAPGLDTLRSAAPILIPLPDDDTEGRLLQRLLYHCNQRPMFSLLALAKPIEQIMTHWQPLHWAHMADGQKLLLRFADTRTLACLPAVLSLSQQAALQQDIKAWHYIDRHGELAVWSPPEPDTVPVARLMLDDNQYAALLAQTEVDQALTVIREHTPDLLPDAYAASSFYQHASAALHLADQHGIESWPDRLTLIGAACLSQGDLIAHNVLAPLLANPPCAPGTLGKWLMSQPAYRQAMDRAAGASMT